MKLAIQRTFIYLFKMSFVGNMGHGRFSSMCSGSVVVRTLSSRSREPGSNSLAAISKLWQFFSSYVATIHSVV